MNWPLALATFAVTFSIGNLIIAARSRRWSRAYGYYRGLADQSRLMIESSGPEDYLFRLRDAIADALGEKEARRFVERSLIVHHSDE